MEFSATKPISCMSNNSWKRMNVIWKKPDVRVFLQCPYTRLISRLDSGIRAMDFLQNIEITIGQDGIQFFLICYAKYNSLLRKFAAEKTDRDTWWTLPTHNMDVIMRAMASQTTSVSVVCLTVCSCGHHRKHQSFASLAFVREIQRRPVDSPPKGPVTRGMLPFDEVIMKYIDTNMFDHWNIYIANTGLAATISKIHLLCALLTANIWTLRNIIISGRII